MLKGKIVLIDGSKVYVDAAEGQRFVFERADFEGEPAVGLEVVLVASVLGSEDAARTSLARDLLNQLINT